MTSTEQLAKLVKNYGWHEFPVLSSPQLDVLLAKDVIDHKDGSVNRVRINSIDKGTLKMRDITWYISNAYRTFINTGGRGYAQSRLPVYSKLLGTKPKITGNKAVYDLGERGKVEIDFFSVRDSR
ncbi:MAG: hypothetical protein U9R08_00640 [Nanoarchaeota archaeon]|nr:hypothetical protein [Nanoarchaeota archaeon]